MSKAIARRLRRWELAHSRKLFGMRRRLLGNIIEAPLDYNVKMGAKTHKWFKDPRAGFLYPLQDLVRHFW